MKATRGSGRGGNTKSSRKSAASTASTNINRASTGTNAKRASTTADNSPATKTNTSASRGTNGNARTRASPHLRSKPLNEAAADATALTFNDDDMEDTPVPIVHLIDMEEDSSSESESDSSPAQAQSPLSAGIDSMLLNSPVKDGASAAMSPISSSAGINQGRETPMIPPESDGKKRKRASPSISRMANAKTAPKSARKLEHEFKESPGPSLRPTRTISMHNPRDLAAFQAKIKAGPDRNGWESDSDTGIESDSPPISSSTALHDGPPISEETSDDDEKTPQAKRRRLRRGANNKVAAAAAAMRGKPAVVMHSSDDEAEEEEEEEEDSDEEDEPTTTTSKARAAASTSEDEDDEDDDSQHEHKYDDSSDEKKSSSPSVKDILPRTPPRMAAALKPHIHTPVKSPPVTVPIAPSSTPARSPVKVWHDPVSGRGSAGAMSAGSRAPAYHIKVLGVADLGTAMNNGGRVAHLKTIVYNMKTAEHMLIVAYGPDAISYQTKMQTNKCYTLQLEASAVPKERPIALFEATTVYRIARGSDIRAYIPEKSGNEDLERTSRHVTLHAVLRKSIKELAVDSESEDDNAGSGYGSSPSGRYNVCGVVHAVTNVATRNNTGMKVTIGDEHASVKVMFFDARPGLKRGDTLAIIGATKFINKLTKVKELSIYSSTFVATNSAGIRLSEVALSMERKNQLDKLYDVSAVPCGELTTMEDLILCAATDDTEGPIGGTVHLALDSEVPATGNFWYNGCNKCMKKMRPTGQQDADGNHIYAHEIDGQHEDTTYTEHFLFNGRFKDPTNSLPVYRHQVNDVIGTKLFGMSAEELVQATEEERIQRIKGAMGIFKYNVTINKDGTIATLIMVG